MGNNRWFGSFLMAAVFLCVSQASVFAGAGGSGAPWYPNEYVKGKEWSGTLFINFVDTGSKKVEDRVGSSVDPVLGYTEYVVYVYFSLVLYPIKTNDDPLFFGGIGKTCDQLDPYWPVCDGSDAFYDKFYLPGDYTLRFGAALHNFLREKVFPAICGTQDCGALNSADFQSGQGNAYEAVTTGADFPWYWVQPIGIVIF